MMLITSMHLLHQSRLKGTALLFTKWVKKRRPVLIGQTELTKNNKTNQITIIKPKGARNMTPSNHLALTPLTRKTSSVPQTHSKNYLIYRCSGGIGTSFCSGLGNREIGIVASYLLANATNRKFGIIMTHPCQVTNFLVPNTYNWIIPQESIKNRTSRNLYVRNNRRFTESLARIDFNKNYTEEVVYIQGNQEYHKQLLRNKLYKTNLKWMQRLATHRIYQTVMLTLFKLHPNVQKKKDAFFKKARPSAKSKVMCAQVRMGKNPTIPWDNRPMNSLENVLNIWNFFDKRDNKSSIFVTTDSSKVIASAKKHFGARFITTEGPIIHIDKAYRGSVCAGMEKLILDQMILVDCDTLVVSSSSFGRIPFYMRSKPGGYIFMGGKVPS